MNRLAVIMFHLSTLAMMAYNYACIQENGVIRCILNNSTDYLKVSSMP